MKRAAAWNVMGVERSTQAAAEEAARRAGMSLAEWLDETVAEQAAGQGIVSDDLDLVEPPDEPFYNAPRTSSSAPAARGRDLRERDAVRAEPKLRDRFAERASEPALETRPEPRPEVGATRSRGEDRLEQVIAQIESNAALREERTARALETMAEWIARKEASEAARGNSPAPKAEPVKAPTEPRRAAPEPVRPAARSPVDLQDAIERIQRRRSELDRRQGWETPGRAPRRDPEPPPAPMQLSAPISKFRAPPVRDLKPAPKPQGDAAVNVLRAEIAELNTSLARIRQEQSARAAAVAKTETVDRHLTPGETDSLRSELAAMRRSLGELAPRNVTVALEGAIADLGQRLDAMRRTPVSSEQLRPLEDLLGQTVHALRANDPSSAARNVEADLKAFSERIDELTRSAVDPAAIDQIRRQTEDIRQMLARAAESAPIARLERQIEQLADRTEKLTNHPWPAPEIRGLTAQFADTRAQIERAMSPTVLKAVEQRLENLAGRIDEALKRPVPIADPSPIHELARRVDALAGAVDRQASQVPSTAKLEAAVAEIARKLDRSQTNPDFDPRTIDLLALQIENLQAAVDRQSSTDPVKVKFESALVDIGRKLEMLAAAPGLDGRQIGQLGQRVESLKELVERQAAAPVPHKIEAAIADIGRKLDRPLAAPRFDTRPLEDISRQIESVKAAVQRPDATAPALANIESALADLGRKLDRAAYEHRPVEDIAQQIEALRAVLEQQTEAISQAASLEVQIADIGRKLDRPPQGLADQMAIKSTLQALSARVDDGFRKIGEQAHTPADPALELELLDELARGLSEIRGAIDRQGDFSANSHRIEAAIADLANRLDTASEPAQNQAALQETLQLLLARLQDWSNAPSSDSGALQDLVQRVDDLRYGLEAPAELSRQLAALTGEVRDLRAKLDTRDAIAGNDRVQALAQKLDRADAVGSDLRALETLVRELGSRPMKLDTSAIEWMFDDLGRKIEGVSGSQDALAPFVDAISKIEARLEAMDSGSLEQSIHDLAQRLDPQGGLTIADDQMDRAATLIAERLGSSGTLGADTELLLRQIMEIHERLDALGSESGSNGALEKTVSDLVAEFEETRKLMLEVVEPAASFHGVADGIADLRAEQANAERRMAARVTRVQEILEELSERLGDLEAGGPEPAPRPASAPAASHPFAIGEIPDRAPSPLAQQTGPLPFGRPVSEGRATPIEPGAPAPRGRFPQQVAAPPVAAKPTDLQAHIAAARRAAMSEMSSRRETQADGEPKPELLKRAGAIRMGALKRAQDVLATRRVPFLIGAVLLVAAATVAISELRGGQLPLIHRADIVPVAPVETPVASAAAPVAADARKVDLTPTGSIDGAKAPASSTASKPSSDLIASLPEGLPDSVKSAVLAGNPAGQTEIALRFIEGRGVARDPKIGARWMELAATQGQPYAQYRIGALYERGVGVAKDSGLARAWYQKAAAAGNARAIHNLAVMNAEDGGSGKPDYAAAAAGFHAAAEFGVRDSQFNLGVLYGRGLGVAQDLTQSWLWFSLAAQQGDGDAAKKRDDVAAKLDPKTFADAQKTLAEFKLKPLNPSANEQPQPPGGWEPKGASPQAAKPASNPGAPATKS